ncbi:MAG: hypothetical protein M3Q58_16240 [Bacteroidota bacterium]|nr:hypothetical protein [Bacteroidota bacterium]
MLENLPIYISWIFGITTILTFVLLVWTIKNSRSETVRKKSNLIISVLILWLIIQATFAINSVYNSDTNFLPPKILLFGILPTVLTVIILFTTLKGRQFIDSLPLKNLTYLNIVRVPVEFILFWLFLNEAVPQLMTFEGRNFDIFAGITAPLIAYWGFTKGVLNKKLILIWNFICLGLLINIVVNAFLSAPSPFQMFAFEQPNLAILNFPFIWLPTFIVPIVLFGHLTSIRLLTKRISD